MQQKLFLKLRKVQNNFQPLLVFFSLTCTKNLDYFVNFPKKQCKQKFDRENFSFLFLLKFKYFLDVWSEKKLNKR